MTIAVRYGCSDSLVTLGLGPTNARPFSHSKSTALTPISGLQKYYEYVVKSQS
jgi:hypothetical protein